ncbi:S-adenosylmethionine:tRNA ribosyltransferase-isomerase [Nocardioides sp. GXZ039]|uniref:S-adenosylmethionine:tRNA ribosyltransferase-isomerase n=1 Tax=Nocardioides sp. GXZ039 TaxID=3136018 RepID=UPI0030F4099A
MNTLAEHPTTRFQPPPDAFAPAPAEERGVARGATRLLVATRDGISHAHFHDLAEHLRPGDLVVVNNSAVVPAQLDARSTRHGAVVVHLATPLDDGTWVVEVRTAPDASRAVLDGQPGDRITAAGATFDLLEPYPHDGSSPTGHGNRLWRAHAVGDVGRTLQRYGRPIAYGYLDRPYPLTAYQTVFATRPGSAEMPSAARPFTAELVTRLVAQGVGVVPITLHTGVSSQEAGEAPQVERFEVSDATARAVNAARAGGGRIVAVGTTVTRALESAVDGDRLVARAGWTERVVTPGDPPLIVSGLISGWHDPAASHLLLVEAVAGPRLTQAAYDAAVTGGYLWHEFGDGALSYPEPAGASGRHHTSRVSAPRRRLSKRVPASADETPATLPCQRPRGPSRGFVSADEFDPHSPACSTSTRPARPATPGRRSPRSTGPRRRRGAAALGPARARGRRPRRG